MHGKDAKDMVLKVPLGTVATDVDTGQVLADLTRHGQQAMIARGGQGGKGNAHFACPFSRPPSSPKTASRGKAGKSDWNSSCWPMSA